MDCREDAYRDNLFSETNSPSIRMVYSKKVLVDDAGTYVVCLYF